jgi:hypothetical protein
LGVGVASQALAGREVALFPIRGTATAEEQERIATALGGAYGKEAGVQMLLPAETAQVAGAAANVQTAAQALAVWDYLVVTAERKGKQHEITIAADSVEDFEMMAPRVARALAKRETLLAAGDLNLLDDVRPKTKEAAKENIKAKVKAKAGKHAAEEPEAKPLGEHHHDHQDLSKPTSGEVAVFPVTATNLTQGQADALGMVFAQAYQSVSGQQTLFPPDTVAIASKAGDLVAAAEALAVAEYVDLRALQVGEDIRISATLCRGDGTVAHQVSASVDSLDDFAEVAQRMALALYYRTTLEGAQDIKVVSAGVAAPSRSLFADRILGVKLQATTTFAEHAAYDPTVSLLFDARLEGERYFLEVGGGFMFPTQLWQDQTVNIRRLGGLVSELGASYYVLKGETSVYVGGGVTPRLLWGQSSRDFGVRMTAYGQAGAMFLRSSLTRLFADLRVAQNLFPTVTFNAATGTARELYPTELVLSLGAGW